MLRQFDFSDDAIFSCIGVSGRDPEAIQAHPLAQSAPAAPRSSLPDIGDVDAFFSAVKSFMQHSTTGKGGQAGRA